MKIGQIIKERYEIVEILGEGGMAFVYKARDKQLQRDVAVSYTHLTLPTKLEV